MLALGDATGAVCWQGADRSSCDVKGTVSCHARRAWRSLGTYMDYERLNAPRAKYEAQNVTKTVKGRIRLELRQAPRLALLLVSNHLGKGKARVHVSD